MALRGPSHFEGKERWCTEISCTDCSTPQLLHPSGARRSSVYDKNVSFTIDRTAQRSDMLKVLDLNHYSLQAKSRYWTKGYSINIDYPIIHDSDFVATGCIHCVSTGSHLPALHSPEASIHNQNAQHRNHFSFLTSHQPHSFHTFAIKCPAR